MKRSIIFSKKSIKRSKRSIKRSKRNKRSKRSRNNKSRRYKGGGCFATQSESEKIQSEIDRLYKVAKIARLQKQDPTQTNDKIAILKQQLNDLQSSPTQNSQITSIDST